MAFSAALADPVQTIAPASPVATLGGPSFSNLGGDTLFPLMTTAIGAGFNGDLATTNAGATMRLEAEGGELDLTINNPALGIAALPFPTGPEVLRERGEYRTSGRGSLLFYGTAGDAALDYTRYGSWLIDGNDGKFASGASWAGGYVTGLSSIPTRGSATYNGGVEGLYSELHIANGEERALLLGDVRLTADFGARTLSGMMNNLQIGSDGMYVTGPANDIAFDASIDAGRNLFSGVTRVASMPGAPNALGANATGVVQGRFFGPDAREVGGVFTLTDGIGRIIGAFGARQ